MYTIGDYVKVTNSNITGKIVNISKQYITILANDKIVKLKKEQIEKIIFSAISPLVPVS